MTLLLDGNLSFRSVGSTSRFFPGTCHVRDVGQARANDRAIWEYAKREVLTIVTFDSDFHELSLLEGWPPKFIWLRTGNTGTAEVRRLLASRTKEINAFLAVREHACLVISD